MKDKFASFKAVEEVISKLEDESSVTFWKRDCRKIKAARVSQTIKPELVYSEITFCCIHGGRNYSSKSSGKRPNQRLNWFIMVVHYLEYTLYFLVLTEWNAKHLLDLKQPKMGNI